MLTLLFLSRDEDVALIMIPLLFWVMVFGLHCCTTQFFCRYILVNVGISFGVVWEIHLFIISFFSFNSSHWFISIHLSDSIWFFILIINSSRNTFLLLSCQDGRWLFISSNCPKLFGHIYICKVFYFWDTGRIFGYPRSFYRGST